MAPQRDDPYRRPIQSCQTEPNAATASIAVLPFTNLSGDPEQEYFSDGISRRHHHRPSKIAGLTVIARNSSFTFKGRSVDVRAVGRDLGVRSVLEGAIRRAGNRVRITAQLVDAATGAHLWADRYDRDLTDIFAVQDDVTHQIVDALKVTLSPAEEARLAGSETSNVDAYDCFLRGREFLLGKPRTVRRSNSRKHSLSGHCELDPNYSQAYAGLGWAYIFDYQNRWSDDPDTLAAARERVSAAGDQEMIPRNHFARCAAALAAVFENDLDRAKIEVEMALSAQFELSPLLTTLLAPSAFFRGNRWKQFRRSARHAS